MELSSNGNDTGSFVELSTLFLQIPRPLPLSRKSENIIGQIHFGKQKIKKCNLEKIILIQL